MSECPGVNAGVVALISCPLVKDELPSRWEKKSVKMYRCQCWSVTHQWKTNSQAVGRRYLSDCPGVNVGVVALVCHPSFEDELPSL